MTNSARPHLVVKLGGSLCASPLRDEWIAALRRWPHALTIVSGGGPFADVVRAMQPMLGYSDDVAHKMAMLAMEQYGLALAELYDGFALAETADDIAHAHAGGLAALWRPSKMVGAASDIAPGWDVTSDSLAAWLARETGAEALLLIKSVDAKSGADLVCDGIVDASFPAFVAKWTVFVAGPAALAGAAEAFAAGQIVGTPFAFAPSTQKIAS